MLFFFFQAEDGIRDDLVTGVQTCALPISVSRAAPEPSSPPRVTRSQPAHQFAVSSWIHFLRGSSCQTKNGSTQPTLYFVTLLRASSSWVQVTTDDIQFDRAAARATVQNHSTQDGCYMKSVEKPVATSAAPQAKRRFDGNLCTERPPHLCRPRRRGEH